MDHRSGHVLAYVLGRHKDEVFLQLKGLLAPFGLTKYYTDYWGAYTRHLEADAHQPGKSYTQHIERKHLTLRTRIKRLVRKTICFSRSTQMHDIVIGLFVNRYAFGLLVCNRKVHICNTIKPINLGVLAGLLVMVMRFLSAGPPGILRMMRWCTRM